MLRVSGAPGVTVYPYVRARGGGGAGAPRVRPQVWGEPGLPPSQPWVCGPPCSQLPPPTAAGRGDTAQARGPTAGPRLRAARGQAGGGGDKRVAGRGPSPSRPSWDQQPRLHIPAQPHYPQSTSRRRINTARLVPPRPDPPRRIPTALHTAAGPSLEGHLQELPWAGEGGRAQPRQEADAHRNLQV